MKAHPIAGKGQPTRANQWSKFSQDLLCPANQDSCNWVKHATLNAARGLYKIKMNVSSQASKTEQPNLQATRANTLLEQTLQTNICTLYLRSYLSLPKRYMHVTMQ
jgi:hypothetical protein